MNEEVKMTADGTTVCCCAWCFPGSSIFLKYPALDGKKISHGMCATHKAAVMAEYEAMVFLSRPVTAR